MLIVRQQTIFLHHNISPHTAAHNVLEHPAYTPNLTPLDHHLFGPLKDVLRGCRFTSKQQVKEAVHNVSESLWNDGPSALKSREAMLKNDLC
ncbi:hypothetical protein J437_LFUL015227 [Ladona fulva]|uniref:Histone-lysine N-methyltransferase SETMAR n=1 Tax=Ladona fulva TaxID=123851 RepID=A0A8K0P7N2_LADFU|nr:hypothetical protein J437_LFUL015227 [Ladona fulva]